MEILNTKNCFISGATGGLGRSIAKEMYAHGCNLFLTARSEAKLRVLGEEILSSADKKRKVYFASGNLHCEKETEKIITTAREQIGKIDILINTAGIFLVKKLVDVSLDDLQRSFNINVKAPFIFVKEFSKEMIINGWGRIVNIGSSSAYQGFEKTSIYCTTKHALLGLSRSLHAELKEYNVRMFSISPGSIKTAMGKKVKGQDFDTFIDPDEIAKYIAFVISFDKQMVSEEIRLNRIDIK